MSAETPGVDFVRPCNLCPHMKRISLGNILEALKSMRHEVTIDPAVAARARASVERMLEASKALGARTKAGPRNFAAVQ